jgi:hypothetical protein
MSRNRTERARGVTLRTLDLTAMLAGVPLTGDERADAGHAPFAVAEHGGRMYVVCHEGVGWEVTDDDPLVIDIYVAPPSHIAIVPKYQATLTPAEVREAATGPDTDLADLVRTFGSRLESNFWMWHRTLTGGQ